MQNIRIESEKIYSSLLYNNDQNNNNNNNNNNDVGVVSLSVQEEVVNDSLNQNVNTSTKNTNYNNNHNNNNININNNEIVDICYLKEQQQQQIQIQKSEEKETFGGSSHCSSRSLYDGNDTDHLGPSNSTSSSYEDCIVLTKKGRVVRIRTTTTTSTRTNKKEQDQEQNEYQSIVWDVDVNTVCENGFNNDTNPMMSWFHLTLLDSSSNSGTGGGDDGLSSSTSVCVSCFRSDGAIVTIQVNNGEVELVGEFEYGIQAAQWNKNHDVLALITTTTTSNNNDDTEEERKEHNENKEEEEEEEKVKLEDQQQGIIGTSTSSSSSRSSVLLTMNTSFEVLDEMTIPYIVPDSIVSICWNSAGTYLAINSLDHHDTNNHDQNRMMVRIYSFDEGGLLQLKYVGRNEDGGGSGQQQYIPNVLSGVMEWATGNGNDTTTTTTSSTNSKMSNLLTVVAKKGTKMQQILLIETNGLRHGQFDLHITPPSSVTTLSTKIAATTTTDSTSTTTIKQQTNVQTDVLHISYNHPNCDILCVTLKENVTTTTTPMTTNPASSPPSTSTTTHMVRYKIQFYHRSNYHWYMKQEIQYNNNNQDCDQDNKDETHKRYDVVQAKFISNQQCIVFMKNGMYIEYKIQWDPSTMIPIPSTWPLKQPNVTVDALAASVAPNPSTSSCCTILPCAVVIDGCALNVTNLQQSIVPPPMYGNRILFHAPIQSIATTNTTGQRQGQQQPLTSMNNDEGAIDCFVSAVLFLADGTMSVLGYHNNKNNNNNTPTSHRKRNQRVVPYPTILASTTTTTNPLLHNMIPSCGTVLLHPIIISTTPDSVRLLASVSMLPTSLSSVEQVQQQQLCHDTLIDWTISFQKMVNPENQESLVANIQNVHLTSLPGAGRVLGIRPYLDGTGSSSSSSSSIRAVVQLHDGTLYEYTTTNKNHDVDDNDDPNVATVVTAPVLNKLNIVLPEPCPWFVAMKDNMKNHTNDQVVVDHQDDCCTIVLGMSTNQRLYCCSNYTNSYNPHHHDRDNDDEHHSNDDDSYLLLSSGVTSFQVSLEHEYLCYTTSSISSLSNAGTMAGGATTTTTTPHHQVKFISLGDIQNYIHDPYSAGADELWYMFTHGYGPRYVERGSTLVGIVPSLPRIILQLPRGNIEILYPRPILLRFVIVLLQTHQYKVAFEYMRTHKMDLNLFIDYHPHYFMNESTCCSGGGGIKLLLQEIHHNINYLNLFIAALNNQNCMETKYSQMIPKSLLSSLSPLQSQQQQEHQLPSLFDYNQKTNMICQRLRQLMMTKTTATTTVVEENESIYDMEYYLLPILSTFAKEEPPQLGAALLLIEEYSFKKYETKQNKKNKKQQQQQQTEEGKTISQNGGMSGTTTPTISHSKIFIEYGSTALQYLAYLADSDLLFRTALSLYKYELARVVARCTSTTMNPQLYVPLLHRYSTLLPHYYSRYEVDHDQLQQYDSALQHLFLSYKHQEGWPNQVPPTEESTPSSISSVVVGTLQNQFTDCLNLIEKYGLHTLGLQLFQGSEYKEQYRTILLSLGDSLLSMKKNNQTTENGGTGGGGGGKNQQKVVITATPGAPQGSASTALSLYLSADPVDYPRAIRAARVARNWSTFFTLTCQQQYQTEYTSSQENNGDQNKDNKDTESIPTLTNETPDISALALSVAEELVSSAEGRPLEEQQRLYQDAARVLLDYGRRRSTTGSIPSGGDFDDIVFHTIIDYYIQAQAWNEGQRIMALQQQATTTSDKNMFRDSGVQDRVIQGAVTFANRTIADLEERVHTFTDTYERYVAVLQLRKVAIANGQGDHGEVEGEDDEQDHDDIDETGSLFSVASNASNTSLISTASSTGSVNSLSSIISVKTTSSFSLTGSEASLRHKSKYNQIGNTSGTPMNNRNRNNRKKKQQQQGKQKKKKMKPGSVEELNSLVETIISTLTIDESYYHTIHSTILFLIESQNVSLGQQLAKQYEEMGRTIFQARFQKQKEQQQRSQGDAVSFFPVGGGVQQVERPTTTSNITHSVEKKMDDLFVHYKPLSNEIKQLLLFFPTPLTTHNDES